MVVRIDICYLTLLIMPFPRRVSKTIFFKRRIKLFIQIVRPLTDTNIPFIPKQTNLHDFKLRQRELLSSTFRDLFTILSIKLIKELLVGGEPQSNILRNSLFKFQSESLIMDNRNPKPNIVLVTIPL